MSLKSWFACKQGHEWTREGGEVFTIDRCARCGQFDQTGRPWIRGHEKRVLQKERELWEEHGPEGFWKVVRDLAKFMQTLMAKYAEDHASKYR
jgi:NMD protein affecting ribosome stability and mRNA decay